MTKTLNKSKRGTNFILAKSTPITLKNLIDLKGDDLWRHTKIYKSALTNLHEADEIMGRPKLSEITSGSIEDYVSVLEEFVAPSTINRKLSCLNKLLTYAVDREWLTKKPKILWQVEDNERIRWLTAEEETHLLNCLPPATAAFCEILIHTGMRRGELLNLKPEDVDGNYARLWVTKSGKPRSVPLSERAKELIDKWVPFNMEIHRIRRDWLKAKTLMGLDDDSNFVMHTLRHTTATRMLDTTGNLAVVQKMLGHAKITTTMRYAHVADEGLLDAVRKTAEKHGNTALVG